MEVAESEMIREFVVGKQLETVDSPTEAGKAGHVNASTKKT